MVRAGSRSNLIGKAAEILQAKYARRRSVAAVAFQELRDAGAFHAPIHLVVGLQAELGLPEPLRLDQALLEAA